MNDTGRAQHTAELIVDRLARWVASEPDRVAFRYRARPGSAASDVTWSELWRKARSIAIQLEDVTTPSDNVAVACDKPLDYVAGLVACFQAGCVAVPVPVATSRRAAPRALSILVAARPAALLVSGKPPGWLSETGTPAVIDIAAEEDEPPMGAPAYWRPRAAITPASPALIQFSSGSTGRPKGIGLTHGNIAANCRDFSLHYRLDESSVGVSWLPLHHDMGLIGHVMGALWSGARSTLMDPLRFLQDPLSWLQMVSDEQATATCGPNFAFEMCVRAARNGAADISSLDLSRLTSCVCGGESVHEATAREFVATFAPVGLDPSAFIPSYGLAEATVLVSAGRNPDGPRFVKAPKDDDQDALSRMERVADLGAPVESVRVRICRRDGVEAPIGEVGEVEISGPSVGCLVDESGQFTAAAPLRVGDFGYLEDGRLRIIGRISDLIIIRGQNISAVDVETATQESDDRVVPGGVAALGIADAGTETLVILAEVQRGTSAATVAEVRANVMQGVIAKTGHAPRDIAIAPFGALPRTSSGKMRRFDAERLYMTGQLSLINAKAEGA